MKHIRMTSWVSIQGTYSQAIYSRKVFREGNKSEMQGRMKESKGTNDVSHRCMNTSSERERSVAVLVLWYALSAKQAAYSKSTFGQLRFGDLDGLAGLDGVNVDLGDDWGHCVAVVAVRNKNGWWERMNVQSVGGEERKKRSKDRGRQRNKNGLSLRHTQK